VPVGSVLLQRTGSEGRPWQETSAAEAVV
jgi:hypothetical protein